MAELREQMRKGASKLHSEFRDISSGLNKASDEAKLKALEDAHRTVLGKATSAFGRAEEEKQRQRELKESEAERTQRERAERERKANEKREREKVWGKGGDGE